MVIPSKLGSGTICGKQCSIIITEFDDKYFIIISDNGKIGTLVEISFEANVMKTSYTTNSKTLFGIDKPEAHAVAQGISEVLEINKPVIFAFSLKEYNAEVAADMSKLVSDTLKKESSS